MEEVVNLDTSVPLVEVAWDETVDAVVNVDRGAEYVGIGNFDGRTGGGALKLRTLNASLMEGQAVWSG